MKSVKRVVSLLTVFVFMMVSVLPVSVFAAVQDHRPGSTSKVALPDPYPSVFAKDNGITKKGQTRTIHLNVYSKTQVVYDIKYKDQNKSSYGNTLQPGYQAIKLMEGENNLTVTTTVAGGKKYTNKYTYEVVYKGKKEEPKKQDTTVIKKAPIATANRKDGSKFYTTNGDKAYVMFNIPKGYQAHVRYEKYSGGTENRDIDIDDSEQKSKGIALTPGKWKVKVSTKTSSSGSVTHVEDYNYEVVQNKQSLATATTKSGTLEVNGFGEKYIFFKIPSGYQANVYKQKSTWNKPERTRIKYDEQKDKYITLTEGKWTVTVSTLPDTWGADYEESSIGKNPYTYTVRPANTQVTTTQNKLKQETITTANKKMSDANTASASAKSAYDKAKNKKGLETQAKAALDASKEATKAANDIKSALDAAKKDAQQANVDKLVTAVTKAQKVIDNAKSVASKTLQAVENSRSNSGNNIQGGNGNTNNTQVGSSSTSNPQSGSTPTSDPIKVTTPAPKDKTAPHGTVTIDKKKGIYEGNKVDLKLTVGDDVSKSSEIQVKLSNDNDFRNNKWEKFRSVVPGFKLDDKGTNTVYVQFKDKAGKISKSMIKDTIPGKVKIPKNIPPATAFTMVNPTTLTQNTTIAKAFNGPTKVTFPSLAGTTTDEIHYTLDGTEPTYASTKWDGKPINIASSKTLKAMSIYDLDDHKGPRPSFVVTYNFTLPITKVVEVKDPTDLTQDTTEAQTYNEPIKIKFPSIAGTKAQEIMYSLNGTDPYIQYKGEAVEITESKTLKVRTIYDSADPNDHRGPRPSFIETYNFTINK